MKFISYLCMALLLSVLHLCLVRCTQYYLTRSDLKKRLDESKKSSNTKDPIHMSNSNSYLVEDGAYGGTYGGYGGYESHEMGEYEYPHRYVTIEKKASKWFGDEISFVIIVVTLTVFFGILSSLLIPLTLLLINGGGGLFSPFGNSFGNVLPVAGIGALNTGLLGRRKRSLNEYAQRFTSALGKFDIK